MSNSIRIVTSLCIASLLLAASISYSQQQQPQIKGSGVMKTEARKIEPFSKIEIKSGADMDISIGQQQSVELEAEDNILPVVTTEVKDGTLIVSSTANYNTDKGVKAHIVVPSLKGITITGAGDVSVKGINEPKFALTIKGAGDIKLEGKAEELSVDLAGAGDVDTRQLAVQRATVNLRGAGDVKVRAEKTLEANLRGKGDIRYTGNPEEVIQNISGLGDVKPL